MKFFPLPSTLRRSAFFSLTGLAFSAATLLHGQSVTYAGSSPALNFGSVNVCPSGATTPAPCSKTLTLTYNITAGGALSTPKVVTVGAPNLDYTLASGSTCTGAVIDGATCTVNVTLVPRYAGTRKGAVEIVDESGNMLATTLVYGIGTAPQIAFDPAAQTTIGVAPQLSLFVAVDESGYVYLEDFFYGSITKMPAAGGPSTSIGSGLSAPLAVALDGAGNVFVAGELDVSEVSANGAAQVMLPFGDVLSPSDVAVDGAGNVSVLNSEYIGSGNAGEILELPTGGGDMITLPIAGLDFPYSLALNDFGDIFISGTRGTPLYGGLAELRPDGSEIMLPFLYTYAGQLAADAAGDVFIGTPPQILQLPTAATVPFAVSSFPNSLGSINSSESVAVSAAGDVFGTLNNGNVVELRRSQPPPLGFTETASGSTSQPQSVRIQNIGNMPLSLSGLSVSANFALIPGPGTPEDCTASTFLAPGARCNLSITFDPEDEGPLTGSVTLSDNALNDAMATHAIQLSGIGGIPQVVSLSTTTLQFGSIAFPGTATQPLTLTNTGTNTLTISTSINGPSYTISSSTCTRGLTAGHSCTLQVKYSPVQVGLHDDRLTILYDGGATPTVALLGSATGISVVSQQLKFSPTGQNLVFGTVALGGASKLLPLTIIAYGVPEPVSMSFSINGPSYTIRDDISNCVNGAIGSGQSCQIYVRYQPYVGGQHDDRLTITPSGGVRASQIGLVGSAD